MMGCGTCVTTKRKRYEPRKQTRVFTPPVQETALLNGLRKLTKSESIEDLIYHMELAKFTVDLYVMSILSNRIMQCLLYLRSTLVRIRIILDERYRCQFKTVTNELRKAGIDYRWKPGTIPFKSRLCLIDSTLEMDIPNSMPLCLMSINLTNRADVVDNIQYALIITGKMTIFQYQRQFELMWKEIGRLKQNKNN